MIKILIINTIAIDYNGVTDCLLQYLRAMDRTDMQIDILSAVSVNPKMEKNFLEIGCRIYRIECRKKNPILYVFKLANLVKKEKYDIVHAHGNSATLAFDMLGAFFGKCKVRIAHCHSTKSGNNHLDKALRPFFYRLYTQGIACGGLAGEWLFPEREYLILPNGRKLEEYKYNFEVRKKIQKEYDLEDTLVVGHVGRFNISKNQKFVVEIFEELLKIRKDVKMVLMGDGALFQSIKESAARKGLDDRIIFTGSVGNISEMLSAMDVMILPSLHEGMPLVVMEWQAAGLPCIISDNITKECAVTELVHYLPLSAGAKKWAEMLDQISKEKTDRKLSIWRDKLRAAGYDIEDNARELRALYEQLYEENSL